MPTLSKMQDCITVIELGNGRFLLNFNNEDDLQAVLKQGPFHYNYFMFVLVQWEPVVDKDYPWIILVLIEPIGIPLHLWTDGNLNSIGDKLGLHDFDAMVGKISVDIYTRKTLRFSRIKSKDGEEKFSLGMICCISTALTVIFLPMKLAIAIRRCLMSKLRCKKKNRALSSNDEVQVGNFQATDRLVGNDRRLVLSMETKLLVTKSVFDHQLTIQMIKEMK